MSFARRIEERVWSDGDRFWYDAPLSGYYMVKGEPGLFHDSGTVVRGLEEAIVHSRGQFAALIKAVSLFTPLP